MSWFRKDKPIVEFHTVDLPGNIGSVSIPADFTVKMEDDSTLLAYPQTGEALSLCFSSLSRVTEGCGEDEGKTYVRDKAIKERLEYQEFDDRGIVTSEEETKEKGTPLIIRFWEVGMGNTVVIVSATILRAKRNDGVVRSILNAMPVILQSIKITRIHKIIESGDRKVETVTETTNRTSSTIAPFGSEEQRWLDSSLARAKELGLRYGSGGELGPEELDRIFSRWMSEENEKEPDESVADALGAAFGTRLVDHNGFHWVVLTDELGTEYVVKHGLSETTAYPRASVQKRIANKQPEFFRDLYVAILDLLKRSE